MNLQPGERLTGLTIHVAPGASSLRGRLVAPDETVNAITSPGATETVTASLSPQVTTGASPSATANVSPGATASASPGATISVPPGAGSGASPDAASAGATSEPRLLRVHLVPAEREEADNVLRYAESAIAPDGTFAFNNLAPGRYWLLTRPAPDTADIPPRPLAYDADARTRLRREAETSNVSLALAPCQRVSEFVLRRASK